MIITLRAKPVEIQGVRWDGSAKAYDEIVDFVLDGFGKIRASADAPQIEVWNHPEKQWIPVPVGCYVLKGVLGEFYPCEEKALLMKYDVV